MYLIVQSFGHLIRHHIIIGVPHTLAKLANGYNLFHLGYIHVYTNLCKE